MARELNNEDGGAVIPPWVFFVVTFLLSFAPSQPYLTTYLEKVQNFEENDLNSIVWPASTYSMFVLVIPIGIFASRHPSLSCLVGIVSRIIVCLILLLCSSILSMIVAEICYAFFLLSDSVVLVSMAVMHSGNEDQYAYLASGINFSREVALVLSALFGQLFFEKISGSNLSSLKYLFVMSLIASILALVWYCVFVTTPLGRRGRRRDEPPLNASDNSSPPAGIVSSSSPHSITSICSLSSLSEWRRSIFVYVLALSFSFAAFVTAADYNFMLLVPRSDSNLGLIVAGLDTFGAIGAASAGFFFSERKEGGLLAVLLCCLVGGGSYFVLYWYGEEGKYSLLVAFTIVPWACYQTLRTLITIFISRTIGQKNSDRLPIILSLSTLLGLGLASCAQGVASLCGGSTQGYFLACVIFEAFVSCGLLIVIATNFIGAEQKDYVLLDVLVDR